MSRLCDVRLISVLLFLVHSVVGFAMPVDETTLNASEESQAASEVRPKPPEPKISLSSVRMIPIYSVGADLQAMNRMSEFFKARMLKEDFGQAMLLEIGQEAFGGPYDADTPGFHFRGYFTQPKTEFYGDLVSPLDEGFADEVKSDADATSHQNGVYEIDGMTVVLTAKSFGLSYGENLAYSVEDAVRIRRFMKESAGTRTNHVCFAKSQPYKIGRSVLKSQLNAVRSLLHTQAQRRDDEAEVNHLATATFNRSLISLLDAFFNETQAVEYSIDFDEDRPSISASITIDALSGTALDRYISRIHSQRSSLLSYLHPEQQGFVSTTVPLSDELAKNLPLIAGLSAQSIASDGQASTTFPGIESALRQISEDKTIECLVQALPSSDETLSFITIVPLDNAGSLQSPLIQLVSAVAAETKSTGVALDNLGPWPVHDLSQLGLGLPQGAGDNDGAVKKHSFVVSTDDCIAWCLASEEDFPLLQSVLERDFAETPAAKRFQRTAFAASTTHSAFKLFSEQVFDEKLSDLKVPDDESPLSDGRLEFRLTTKPSKLTLTARFDNDAIGDGVSLVSASVEALAELLNSYYE